VSDIYGALGIAETDYAFVNTIGQKVVYDATQQVLGDHNADLAASEAVFIESSTWDHTIKYKLPGNGYLQRKTSVPSTMLVKPHGGWNVSFPLDEYGAGVAWDRVTLAKMSMGQYNLALETVKRKDRNTRRHAILQRLFDNTEWTFKDEDFPDLLIEPLANGDAVTYPPVLGSIDEATANNYLVSQYTAASITDTNDPIPTLVNALEKYLGTPTGGSKIAVFCNDAQSSQLKSLSNFDPVPNRFVEYGANVSLVPFDRFPAGLPGRVLGETDSALLVEWRWIPANYLVAIHLEAPQPLRRRIDPPEQGLGDGLVLTSQDMNQPLKHSEWSHRFGIGCANRLNGAVMFLDAGSSYVIPTLYAS
jgi:hypothetical protein